MSPLHDATAVGQDAASATPSRLSERERQVAERLGIAYFKLRDARKRGEIRAVKLGRTWLYDTDELRRFVSGDPPASKSRGRPHRKS